MKFDPYALKSYSTLGVTTLPDYSVHIAMHVREKHVEPPRQCQSQPKNLEIYITNRALVIKSPALVVS